MLYTFQTIIGEFSCEYDNSRAWYVPAHSREPSLPCHLADAFPYSSVLEQLFLLVVTIKLPLILAGILDQLFLLVPTQPVSLVKSGPFSSQLDPPANGQAVIVLTGL